MHSQSAEKHKSEMAIMLYWAGAIYFGYHHKRLWQMLNKLFYSKQWLINAEIYRARARSLAIIVPIVFEI